MIYHIINHEVGSVVGELAAYDPDGESLIYKMLSSSNGFFKLVGDKVMIEKPLDYTLTPKHTITIRGNGHGRLVPDPRLHHRRGRYRCRCPNFQPHSDDG